MRVITDFIDFRNLMKKTGRVNVTDEEIRSICDTCNEARLKLHGYIRGDTKIIFVMEYRDIHICNRMDFQELLCELDSINTEMIKLLEDNIRIGVSDVERDEIEKKIKVLTERKKYIRKLLRRSVNDFLLTGTLRLESVLNRNHSEELVSVQIREIKF